MRFEMETLDDPIFIEDYGDSICVEGDQSCLLNLSIEQASQLSEILRVRVLVGRLFPRKTRQRLRKERNTNG